MTPSKEAGQPLPDVATNLDCKNEMPRVLHFYYPSIYLTFLPGDTTDIFNFLTFWSKPTLLTC